MTQISELNTLDAKEMSLLARQVRENILVMTHAAGSGHPGGSLSAVDILTVLYSKHLKHYKEWKQHPDWENRDRFVLSKGHASSTLYSVLAEMGYFDKEELKTFRNLHSRLQGHPSFGFLPGIEVSTGSLGQGLSLSCGIALGLKLDKKSSRVYALLGDGELQEGQVWEAAMSAAHYKLGNITSIIDRNCLQIDGSTECVMSIGSVAKKFESFGWQTLQIDGHNHNDIYQALQKSVILGEKNSYPVAIIANTVKGKGVSFMENNALWHGKAPNNEETTLALNEIRGKQDVD